VELVNNAINAPNQVTTAGDKGDRKNAIPTKQTRKKIFNFSFKPTIGEEPE
jgi:hypothetical protein